MPTTEQLYEVVEKINKSLTDFQLKITAELTEVKANQIHQQKEIDALGIDLKTLNTKMDNIVESIQPSKSKTAIMYVFFLSFVSSAVAMVWRVLFVK